MQNAKISRRALAQMALAGAVSAQQAAPPDDIEEARRQLERASETLLKHQVSMATEPAFQFKA